MRAAVPEERRPSPGPVSLPVVLISLLVGLFCPIGSPCYAQDTSCGIVWYPAIQLSDSTHDAHRPKIALSGDDTVHVTWWEDQPLGIRLPYIRSVMKNVFEPVREMLPDSIAFPTLAHHPFVLANGTKVFMFFVNGSGSPARMRYSNDGGTTYSPVIELSQDLIGVIFYAAIHESVIALHHPKSATDRTILRSTNSGQTWTRTTEDLEEFTRFSLTPGMFHLVQATAINNAAEVKYQRSSNLGDTWEIDTVISDVDGYYSDLPTIAGSTSECGTGLLAAWRDTKYGVLPGIDIGASVISRASVMGGEQWLPENLLTPEPRGFNPSAVINGNVRAVVWDYQLSFYTFHAAIRGTNHSLTEYCPMVDLTADESGGGNINVAVSSHAIHTVYGKKIGSTFRIFYRRGEFIQKQVSFSTSTGLLEFDSTLTDPAPQSLPVVVSNNGPDTLILGTILTTDPENFTASPPAMAIPGFASDTMHVSFHPQQAGTKTGKVLFYHNGASSPDCITITGTALWQQQTTSYLKGRWNLVSLPFSTAPLTKIPSLHTFENGAYRITDTLRFGKGYWLKPADSVFTFYGTATSLETLDVQDGWNLIGSVSVPVSVSSITTIPGAIIQSDFYGYDGTGYVITETLQPGRAYWVKVRQDGRLLMKWK